MVTSCQATSMDVGQEWSVDGQAAAGLELEAVVGPLLSHHSGPIDWEDVTSRRGSPSSAGHGAARDRVLPVTGRLS